MRCATPRRQRSQPRVSHTNAQRAHKYDISRLYNPFRCAAEILGEPDTLEYNYIIPNDAGDIEADSALRR